AKIVTVDTVAPGAPTITSFSNDTGVLGDGITSDNTLALAGTAAANSTVKVFDGATPLGQVATDGSGAWTFTTAALSSTLHTFTATAADAAGNTSAASAALTVTVASTGSTVADLTATNLTFDGTALGYKVGDAGAGAAAASTTGIYLSKDATITTADT